jgi:Flp pilus assembly protein TadG
MTLARRLATDSRGVSAVEFALIAPVLFMAMVGITQLGIMFFASAGLKYAVAEGARFANTSPRPSPDAIVQRVKKKRFGIKPELIESVAVSPGVSDSADYYDITVTYTVPTSFVFVDVPPVKLSETRRAYIYPLLPT